MAFYKDLISGSVARGDESMYEGNDNDQASRATDEANDAVPFVGTSTQPHWGEDMDSNGSLPGRTSLLTICCHLFSLAVH